MNKRTFYLKALGLMVMGSVTKAAVQSISRAISAPTTVVNYNYPNSPEPKPELKVVEDPERE